MKKNATQKMFLKYFFHLKFVRMKKYFDFETISVINSWTFFNTLKILWLIGNCQITVVLIVADLSTFRAKYRGRSGQTFDEQKEKGIPEVPPCPRLFVAENCRHFLCLQYFLALSIQKSNLKLFYSQKMLRNFDIFEQFVYFEVSYIFSEHCTMFKILISWEILKKLCKKIKFSPFYSPAISYLCLFLKYWP